MEKGIRSLQEAKALRKVAGDIVVDEDDKIVTDPAWLWDWERELPDSYARKAIEHQERLNKGESR